MGIRGMETYLEKHSNACYQINVIEEIRSYKRKYRSNPTIVIDGMSIMRYIYKFRNLSWIYGGQLKEYEESLKDFLRVFQGEGVELVFFFDGPFVATKLNTWIKRRRENLEQIYSMLDNLSDGGRISYHENSRLFILPAGSRLLTSYVAKKCGCKVFNSVRDCDLEIAEYAAQNNCMAVIAQDTDFVIFESAMYYWSMKNFDLNTMTTLNYDRQALASSLGLTTGHLPLLASLLGNDVISSDELMSFHQKVTHQRGQYNGNRRIHFGVIITEVAKFIKHKPHGSSMTRQHLEELAQHVFSDLTKSYLIQESIMSYDYLAETNKKPDCPHSTNENWANILKKIHEGCLSDDFPPTMYGIIVQQKYTCSTCIEDYRLSDLPATQTVLKPLRQKMYGVLLFEKPRNDEVKKGIVPQEDNEDITVEELVVCGPNSLDRPVFVTAVKPKVHHPGLLALWGTGAFEERWNLLGDMFRVDVNRIRQFPAHIIVPILTLKYLQGKIDIQLWELRAIVSSAVLVSFYEASFFMRIPASDTLHSTRPFRLFTLISRSYSLTILILQVLGRPIPLDRMVYTNYMDGKLFHYKYQQSYRHATLPDLCDNNVLALEQCSKIMGFLMEP